MKVQFPESFLYNSRILPSPTILDGWQVLIRWAGLAWHKDLDVHETANAAFMIHFVQNIDTCMQLRSIMYHLRKICRKIGKQN